MKKLSAILSVFVILGVFHQGVVLADTVKEKKAAKTNFSPKHKHAEGTASMAKPVTEAPAVVTPPPAPPIPVASPSPESSPAV